MGEMKSAGIVRRTDDLGRVVIPKELRRTLNIGEGTPMEIFIQGDCIILRKYSRGCLICGKTENVVEYKEHVLCRSCLMGFEAAE